MPNRRARTRRKENVIISTISNKAFIITSISLIIIIALCLAIMKFLSIKEKQEIAKEKERINAQIEEIYSISKDNINSVENYKTDSIIRISAVGDILCGNNLRQFGKDYNNIFTDISKCFKDSDLTIGTYETNITEETKPFADAIKNSRN